MNQKAFTFVELIVTVSIIVLVSIVSITSFFRFFGEQEIQSQLQILQSNIDSLKRAVENKDILDYKFSFYKGKNYYDFLTNSLHKPITISLSQSGDIQIQKNSSFSGIVKLNIYKNGKFEQYLTGKLDSIYELQEYSPFNNYAIKGVVEDNSEKIMLNNLQRQVFSKGDNKLFLSTLNNTTTSISSIYLTNILGKKSIIDNEGNSYTGTIFTFEKNGTETSFYVGID